MHRPHTSGILGASVPRWPVSSERCRPAGTVDAKHIPRAFQPGVVERPADVVPVHQSGKRPPTRVLSGTVRALRRESRAATRGQWLPEAAGCAGGESGSLTARRTSGRSQGPRQNRQIDLGGDASRLASLLVGQFAPGKLPPRASRSGRLPAQSPCLFCGGLYPCILVAGIRRVYWRASCLELVSSAT